MCIRKNIVIYKLATMSLHDIMVKKGYFQASSKESETKDSYCQTLVNRAAEAWFVSECKTDESVNLSSFKKCSFATWLPDERKALGIDEKFLDNIWSMCGLAEKGMSLIQFAFFVYSIGVRQGDCSAADVVSFMSSQMNKPIPDTAYMWFESRKSRIEKAMETKGCVIGFSYGGIDQTGDTNKFNIICTMCPGPRCPDEHIALIALDESKKICFNAEINGKKSYEKTLDFFPGYVRKVNEELDKSQSKESITMTARLASSSKPRYRQGSKVALEAKIAADKKIAELLKIVRRNATEFNEKKDEVKKMSNAEDDAKKKLTELENTLK